MKSNPREEDSKSSSEETNQSEQEQANDDMGIGRSYECVFCKRGFTTAQALGGHMNIHRKDRAKPRPNLSVATKVVDDDYGSFGRYPPPPVNSYQPYHAMAHHHDQVNPSSYQSPVPAYSWFVRPAYPQHSEDLSQHLYPFGDDWRRNLSLEIGPSGVDNNREKREDVSEADEVDLELRLGHDP